MSKRVINVWAARGIGHDVVDFFCNEPYLATNVAGDTYWDGFFAPEDAFIKDVYCGCKFGLKPGKCAKIKIVIEYEKA